MALVLLTRVAAGFQLQSSAHLAILGGVVAVAAALTGLQRTWLRGSRLIPIVLAWALVADTLSWFAYQAYLHQLNGQHLPFELCDATLFLTIAVLFSRSAFLFDLIYYWALAGSTMALLTPNVWGQFPSISTDQFFFAHGLVVAAALYLVWSGLMKPRPGSVARAIIGVNLWAAVAGTSDWLFHANYMYLRHKPQNASLLNVLGPWPWYIAAAEPVALALFLLLYLPFWRQKRANAGRP